MNLSGWHHSLCGNSCWQHDAVASVWLMMQCCRGLFTTSAGETLVFLWHRHVQGGNIRCKIKPTEPLQRWCYCHMLPPVDCCPQLLLLPVAAGWYFFRKKMISPWRRCLLSTWKQVPCAPDTVARCTATAATCHDAVVINPASSVCCGPVSVAWLIVILKLNCCFQLNKWCQHSSVIALPVIVTRCPQQLLQFFLHTKQRCSHWPCIVVQLQLHVSVTHHHQLIVVSNYNCCLRSWMLFTKPRHWSSWFHTAISNSCWNDAASASIKAITRCTINSCYNVAATRRCCRPCCGFLSLSPITTDWLNYKWWFWLSTFFIVDWAIAAAHCLVSWCCHWSNTCCTAPPLTGPSLAGWQQLLQGWRHKPQCRRPSIAFLLQFPVSVDRLCNATRCCCH